MRKCTSRTRLVLQSCDFRAGSAKVRKHCKTIRSPPKTITFKKVLGPSKVFRPLLIYIYVFIHVYVSVPVSVSVFLGMWYFCACACLRVRWCFRVHVRACVRACASSDTLASSTDRAFVSTQGIRCLSKSRCLKLRSLNRLTVDWNILQSSRRAVQDHAQNMASEPRDCRFS